MQDNGALEGIYVAVSSDLRRYAAGILYGYGRATEAEDAVHAAFEWSLRKGGCPPRMVAIGRLYRATKYFALQILVDHGELVGKSVKTPRAKPGLITEDVHSRLDECETAEQRATLLQAVRKLPPRELQVWLRCECRGDVAAEVADELGMRKHQVYLTLYNARNRIAWHMEYGDRPFYEKDMTGMRRRFVREADRSTDEKKRIKLAQNRATYARKGLAHA